VEVEVSEQSNVPESADSRSARGRVRAPGEDGESIEEGRPSKDDEQGGGEDDDDAG
jgi:hypothetical protein